MKSSSLVLLALALGLATPVYSDDQPEAAQPAAAEAQAVPAEEAAAVLAQFDIVKGSFARSLDALGSVQDAASAEAAAAVLRHEALVVCNAQVELVGIFTAQGQDATRYMELVAPVLDELDAIFADMSKQVQTLAAVDPAFYGCTELSDAMAFFYKVGVLGLTQAEAGMLDAEVDLIKEDVMIRYEAWVCICSVHDRESAEAAAAKLAELQTRADKRFEANIQLLDSVDAGMVDVVCEVANLRYQEKAATPGFLPEDLDAQSAAAQGKMMELGGLEEPFYGVPELQERAASFIMMPR